MCVTFHASSLSGDNCSTKGLLGCNFADAQINDVRAFVAVARRVGMMQIRSAQPSRQPGLRPAKQLNVAFVALLLILGAAIGLIGVTDARQPDAPAALPSIRTVELPPEARATLQRIDNGGPFPYRKDGTTFGNRERLLPDRPRGWYREYTVKTPGERDRGARRIVTGRSGERYYTADHYRTFRRIVP
jgi:ribonuclease T1